MTYESARQRRARWYEAHSFASARLRYRPPTASDARAVLATYDEVVRRQQGWPDEVHAERALRRLWRRPPVELCAPRLLVCTAGGEIVGDYILGLGPVPDSFSLGWSLGPDGRGRGYGSESLPAMLGYVHRHLGIAQVHLGTRATNEPAIRQIEGSGAVLRTVGPHELPNGELTTGRWYVHEDADVARHLEAHGPLAWTTPCAR